MQLINAAFVVERVAVDGDRVDLEGVQLLLSKGTFLLAEAAVGADLAKLDGGSTPSDASNLLGCVYLEPRGASCYLGLLSVAPAMQGQGIGRQLAAAAEDFARQAGCAAIELRIISPRAATLLPLYARLGYKETASEPFPAEIITKIPCHFIAMTKSLT